MGQKIFLANSVFGSSQKKDSFIKDRFWSNNDKDSVLSIWEKVENGDLFILYYSEQSEQITIVAYGIVVGQSEKGFNVGWVKLRKIKRIKVGSDKSYFNDLVKLEENIVSQIKDLMTEGPLKKVLENYLTAGTTLNETTYRLSQAARKLNVGRNAIIDFLDKNEIKIDSNPNTKLTEDQFLLLKSHFKEEKKEEQELTGEGTKSKIDIELNIAELKISIIQKVKDQENFWWLQARADKWEIENLKVGQTEPYGKFDSSGRVQRHFRNLQVGELVIGYQTGEKRLKGLFEISSKNSDKDVHFRLLYKFEKQTEVAELRNILAFDKHIINRSRVGSFHNLEPELFQEIINTTELGNSSQFPDKPIDSFKNFGKGQCWWVNISKGRSSQDIVEIEIEEEFDGAGMADGQSVLIFDNMGVALAIGTINGIGYSASLKRKSPSSLILTKLFEIEGEIRFDDLKHHDKLANFDLDVFNGIEVSKLEPDLFNKIVDVLSSNTGEATHQEKFKSRKNPSTIAQQIADLDKGEDYLGIDKDVTAFAKVIASDSFSPPLAIALFGQWGTGKSFFMNKLKDRIDQLSATGRSEYRKGIAQIHFNAWSYLDANLWASIVTRIFEGLNAYIGNDSKATKNKKKIEKELKEQLSVLKEERRLIEHQKEANKEKIKELKSLETNTQKDLQKKINFIKDASLDKILKEVDESFKVEQKITEALSANSGISESIKEVKAIVPEKYWGNPELALKEAKSARVFLYEFFNKKKIGWNIFWLISVLLLIAIVPKILYEITPWLKNEFIILPQITLSALAFITPIWKRFKVVYDRLQPIVGVFWTVKQQHEKSIESAIFSHNQLMASVKIEIEQKKSDVRVLNTQIAELQTEIEVLDYKLEHTLSTQSLYSFIEQRAKGDVYKKHLGIISTIRHDFEVLSELFDGSSKEAKNEEFKKYFDKPLERIVLYIDDLDRCPEDQVVEVLEAVNLLMAFPLFIVVVGVDPRWIKNALIKKYELQFGERSDTNGYEQIDASNYLEKIFQVPFHLEQASDDSVKNMLKQLTSINIKEEVEMNTSDEYDILVDEEGSRIVDEKGDSIDVSQKASPTKPTNKKEARNDEHLSLKTRELELIPDMSKILGTNPRAIKRFVNVYHILRAHETLLIDHNKDDDYLVLMFLLALPMGGYRKLHQRFVGYMAQPKNKKAKLDKFLTDSMSNDKGENKERVKLEAQMKELDSLRKLREIPISRFAEQNVFIQRFTFSELA